MNGWMDRTGGWGHRGPIPCRCWKGLEGESGFAQSTEDVDCVIGGGGGDEGVT